jgi:6-phosphofructokinase
MAKRIGVLTAGGDAPGLNVCLKAVVYNAIDWGYEVIGIRKGWEGLLYYDPENPETHAANVMIMTKSRIRDIDRTAGSFLHSSRLDPHLVSPEAVPSFLRQAEQGKQPLDLTDHIKRVVEKLQLEALVVLGDNAALNYAARLSKESVSLIGIPKTVHNDVRGSDYSLGSRRAIHLRDAGHGRVTGGNCRRRSPGPKHGPGHDAHLSPGWFRPDAHPRSPF